MKTFIEMAKTTISREGKAVELKQRLESSGEVWWLVNGEWKPMVHIAATGKEWIDDKLSQGWAVVQI